MVSVEREYYFEDYGGYLYQAVRLMARSDRLTKALALLCSHEADICSSRTSRQEKSSELNVFSRA